MPRWSFSPDALRRRREAAGLTQNALAAKIGTNQATVAYWERGTSNPQLGLFFGLVRALDCKITDLLVDLDNDNEAPNGASVPDDPHLDRLGRAHV